MALLDIKLLSNGDVDLNLNSQPMWLYGKDAAEQMLRVALSIWKNEWFRDKDRGVDWLSALQNRLTTQDLRDEIIRALQKLSIVDEVVDVIIEQDRKNRKAVLTYTVKIDGTFIVGTEEI